MIGRDSPGRMCLHSNGGSGVDGSERGDDSAPASLSHLDERGRAHMVDVGPKAETSRRASAEAVVALSPEGAAALRAGSLKKGAPAEVVRLTALQAAKETSRLLPLCHPLRLTGVEVEFAEIAPPPDPRAAGRWRIQIEVRAHDRTGVEMEAMTGAAAGALALYDMVKGVDRAARIELVQLLEKDGGKSGAFRRDRGGAVNDVVGGLLICSDRSARGEREDGTSAGVRELWLADPQRTWRGTTIVADERAQIGKALLEMARECDVVLTSGGTGLGGRDVTVEATRELLDRELPGLAEAMRARSLQVTPMAMLSRATAGTIGRALVINLPGSPRGARECLEVVLPVVRHAVELLRGGRSDCSDVHAAADP